MLNVQGISKINIMDYLVIQQHAILFDKHLERGDFKSMIDIIQVNELNYCLTLRAPSYSIEIFRHLKLCLATATHNFK